MKKTESLQKLERRPEVRQALREIGVDDKNQSHGQLGRKKPMIVSLLSVFFFLAVFLYFAARAGLLPQLHVQHGSAIDRFLLGTLILAVLLLIFKLLEDFVLVRISDTASRFNLKRLVRLFEAVAIVLLILSVIFTNWYTALVSLGVMSLILGFALQTPITSFIGWIYILINTPYRVGDRIKIGDATGDVIDVGYLDTTLWEFGGQYLSTDHPSGRIIKFPNSMVLSAAVYNYSWPLFPYIWNEIKFYIAYSSDLEFVATVMEEVVSAEIGDEMIERVREYREILARTPVDEIEVQEKPVVLFRVSENTWIEAIVRYLVDPIEAGAVKTRLIQKMLPKLNAAPDRVMFPSGDAR